MNRFRPKRRTTRTPRSRNVDPDTPMMLAAGKQFLERTEDASNDIDALVLFIVDVRDSVGALWAAGRVGLDPEEVDEFVAGVLYPNGKANKAPFVSFWMPRSAAMLELLQETGVDVPIDWRQILESPPPSGSIHTLLKRR